jgi:hypothetical protein
MRLHRYALMDPKKGATREENLKSGDLGYARAFSRFVFTSSLLSRGIFIMKMETNSWETPFNVF